MFGVLPVSAMDSDEEEELAVLLEEEAAADVQEEEHLMVLAALAQLLAINEKPRQGGSAPGRLKAKTGFVLKATSCSTPTTSPMLHFMAREHFGAVIG